MAVSLDGHRYMCQLRVSLSVFLKLEIPQKISFPKAGHDLHVGQLQRTQVF
jgi:hypothetical protein